MAASKVRKDLKLAGFVANEEKSKWEPEQTITWLGLCWNSAERDTSITGNRLDKIYEEIEIIRKSNYTVSAPQLASFTGKIISTGAVVGNISRIMTRHCCMSIAAAECWDRPFKLDSYSINEIRFWDENMRKANVKYCFTGSTPKCFAYSDASSTGCGAYTIMNQEFLCHNMCGAKVQHGVNCLR